MPNPVLARSGCLPLVIPDLKLVFVAGCCEELLLWHNILLAILLSLQLGVAPGKVFTDTFTRRNQILSTFVRLHEGIPSECLHKTNLVLVSCLHLKTVLSLTTLHLHSLCTDLISLEMLRMPFNTIPHRQGCHLVPVLQILGELTQVFLIFEGSESVSLYLL